MCGVCPRVTCACACTVYEACTQAWHVACTCVYTCMQLHVACVLCARVACPGDVCDARVPGVRACARVCARSLETTAQSSVVRLGSGRWLPASREGGPPTFWVSESPGSEPEAPPSPVCPVWAAEQPGLPHHRLPACPGGPRLSLGHCLVGTRVPGSLGVLRAASDPAPAGLQWERQAGGSLPLEPPAPYMGWQCCWSGGPGTGETTRLVRAFPWESSPHTPLPFPPSGPAGLAAKERGAGSGRSHGWGASRLRPTGPPLQQSQRRPWRPRELPGSREGWKLGLPSAGPLPREGVLAVSSGLLV